MARSTTASRKIKAYRRKKANARPVVLWTVGDRQVGCLGSPKEVRVRRVKPVPKDTGDYVLTFGVHKGKTLNEVFAENPGYIDWLGSQTWLYAATKKAVHAFLEQEDVRAEIDRKYWSQDADGNWLTTTKSFTPSEQVAKHFAHGKPTWLKVEYGPFFKAKPRWKLTGGPTPDRTPDEEYRPRSAGPQEPEWDWKPDPARPPFKPMAAWELAADLLDAIENAECVEDLDIIEREEVELLREMLPKHTMERLRQAYRDKRDRFALLSLLPDWKRRDALLALEAIEQQPELEALCKEQAPELHDAVELLRVS